MNCIILLLLLCGCGCGNGVSNSSNGNCSCGNNNYRQNQFDNFNRERRESAYEANQCDDDCDCAERDAYDAASMAPPSWKDFRGITRDCDCQN